MVLYGALADTKVRGDILTWLTSEDQFHDLTLSRRETCDCVSRGFSPSAINGSFAWSVTRQL